MDQGRAYHLNAYLLYLGGKLSSVVRGFSFHIFPVSKATFGPFGQIKISRSKTNFKVPVCR